MSQEPSERESGLPDGSGGSAAQFVANAASGLNQWWRWLLGLVAVVVVWLGVGSIGLSIVGCALLDATSIFGLSCSRGTVTGDGSSIAQLALAGLGFVVGLAGLWLVVRLIHRKPLLRVVTGRPSFDVARYLTAMLVALGVSVVVFLINRFVHQLEVTFRQPDWEFLVFFLFAIVLVPVQTGFEEALYRGYILQGTMLLLRNKLVLALISGALFALPHLTNPEASSFGLLPYVVALISLGVFFALITLLDGGLELAVGYHAMNNLFLGIFANTEGSVIVTPALFTIHRTGYDLFPHVLIDLLGLAVAFLILNHKYKWVKPSPA